MVEIKAAQVKELRDATDISMGECKKALVQAEGNMEEAIKILREAGMAMAAKKASREASEGLVMINASGDAQKAAMVELNCETDFVTKNDTFQEFAAEISADSINYASGEMQDAVKETMAAKIAEIGENLVLRRNVLYSVEGTGGIANYIHLGGKVGVLMEISCEKADSATHEKFTALGKDLCMHVAAANPQSVSRDDIDPVVVAEERAIYEKQMEGKPAEILEKIIGGKIEKFYSQICMLEQGFIKDPDIVVKDLIAKVGTEIGDTLTLKRFERFQLGV